MAGRPCVVPPSPDQPTVSLNTCLPGEGSALGMLGVSVLVKATGGAGGRAEMELFAPLVLRE